MISQYIREQVQEIVDLIENSTAVVAFSGAGISTDSGIPDFRSHKSGLWDHVDPMKVASIYGFKSNPQAFYDWVRPLAQLTRNAQPNPSHYALVDLETLGYLKAIITQNIDMLHTEAGSKTVYELHGHMREATCIQCFKIYDGSPILDQFLRDGIVPKCVNCQGVIKPNVILFGEQLPYGEFQNAQSAASSCDLMIVIGSSLEVAPASDLPLLAMRNNAKLVIINLDKTSFDGYAEVVIHARAAEVLPEIIRRLKPKP